MYLLRTIEYRGQEENYLIRASDNAHIPFDERNKDYQDYLAWLAEGNIPEPWNPEKE